MILRMIFPRFLWCIKSSLAFLVADNVASSCHSWFLRFKSVQESLDVGWCRYVSNWEAYPENEPNSALGEFYIPLTEIWVPHERIPPKPPWFDTINVLNPIVNHPKLQKWDWTRQMVDLLGPKNDPIFSGPSASPTQKSRDAQQRAWKSWRCHKKIRKSSRGISSPSSWRLASWNKPSIHHFHHFR